MADYLKPKLPEWFALITEDGLDDGPYSREQLVPSELPGKPWVIDAGSSPKFFRLLEQRGDRLILEHPTEDGRMRRYELKVTPLEWDPAREAWVQVSSTS